MEFVEKSDIPVATTWNARGIIPENDERNLGLTGNRGTVKANYVREKKTPKDICYRDFDMPDEDRKRIPGLQTGVPGGSRPAPAV